PAARCLAGRRVICLFSRRIRPQGCHMLREVLHIVSPRRHALNGENQRGRNGAMPRTSKAEAPVVMDNDVLTSRHVELDDFTVVFENYHVTADAAPVFKGLPDDRCQCPHWGIVVSGELRLRYADGEDTY